MEDFLAGAVKVPVEVAVEVASVVSSSPPLLSPASPANLS